MPPQEGFWNVNFGNVLTLVTLLLSFWAAHASNRKRIEEDAADRREIKTKVDMIFTWFQSNIIGRRRGQEGD